MRAFVFAVVIGCAGYASAASIYHGQNTDVDKTAEQIDASAPKRCTQLTIKANQGSSGDIYIGNSNVSASNGFQLTATNPTITLTGSINASAVYAIGHVSDQTLSFVCVY